MAAVHAGAPAPHNPFLDLIPGVGVKSDAAPLRLSEDRRRLRPPLHVLHHPVLRGRLASRPAGDVLREAEKLVHAGVKELLVISQDTSAYGLDLRYAESPWRDREVAARFFDIARELGQLGAWIRLHYVYPYPHVDEAMALMNGGDLLPYLDVPFQHASPKVLKAMRRPALRRRRWSASAPGAASAPN